MLGWVRCVCVCEPCDVVRCGNNMPKRYVIRARPKEMRMLRVAVQCRKKVTLSLCFMFSLFCGRKVDVCITSNCLKLLLIPPPVTTHLKLPLFVVTFSFSNPFGQNNFSIGRSIYRCMCVCVWWVLDILRRH